MNDLRHKSDDVANYIHNVLEKTKEQDIVTMDRSYLLDLMIMWATADTNLVNIMCAKDKNEYCANIIRDFKTTRRNIYGQIVEEYNNE